MRTDGHGFSAATFVYVCSFYSYTRNHYDILRYLTTYIHELCKAVLWLLSRGAVEIGMRSGTSSVLQQMSTWPFLATWYANACNLLNCSTKNSPGSRGFSTNYELQE